MTLVQVGTLQKVVLLKLIQLNNEPHHDTSLRLRVFWIILLLIVTAIAAVVVALCIYISRWRCNSQSTDKDIVIDGGGCEALRGGGFHGQLSGVRRPILDRLDVNGTLISHRLFYKECSRLKRP